MIAWCCTILIACLSLMPSEMEVRTGYPAVLEHIVAYGLTGLAFAVGYPGRAWPLTFALVVYGCLLESLQGLSPGRHPHIVGAAASAVGAVLGVAAAHHASSWMKRRQAGMTAVRVHPT